MTKDEWIAAALADASPLSKEQIERLRPIFAPVIAHMNAAAAAASDPDEPVPAGPADPSALSRAIPADPGFLPAIADDAGLILRPPLDSGLFRLLVLAEARRVGDGALEL